MNQAVFSLLPGIATTLLQSINKKTKVHRSAKNLSQAQINKEYIIDDIVTEDKQMASFLFSLGCFKGEPVTVISILSENYVIAIKDARYSIDADLAKAVTLV